MTTCVSSIIEEFSQDLATIPRFRVSGYRKWYLDEEIKAYLRLGNYKFPPSNKLVQTIVLATVEVQTSYQRKGLCKELITKLEELAQSQNYYFRIESVLHLGLAQYLIKRNYLKTEIHDYWFTSLKES